MRFLAALDVHYCIQRKAIALADKRKVKERDRHRQHVHVCVCARSLFQLHLVAHGKGGGTRRATSLELEGAKGTRGGASARPSFRLGPTPGAKPEGPPPAHLKGAGDRADSEELQAVCLEKCHAE